MLWEWNYSMRLYYTPGSSSLASRIVAYEAGLQIDYDKVDLKHQTTASGRSFIKINPRGEVPALILNGGEVLTGVSTVIQFLADQAPGSGLMPGLESLERYRVLEWLGFIGAELHGGFQPLWKPEASDAARVMAVESLHRCFGYLEDRLEGHAYLVGDRFTVADAYGFTVLNWSRFHQVDLSSYDRMTAYMRRIASRPRVREALCAEGLERALAAVG